MLAIIVETGGLVRLAGRLDEAEADRVMAVLDVLTGAVVVDLSELEYISSAGLGVLLATHRRLMEDRQALRLVNLQHRVRNVFLLAGLDRVLMLE